MRFRQAHKTTTYAMVASSFMAVATSGALGVGSILFGFLGIVGSWFWQPAADKAARSALLWTVAAALFFAYQVIAVLSGAELLLAGASFLQFLMVLKLFNRHESKDYLHIYILSFLMLTAGTVLNAEVTYGLFFLCFVISSTWALIIFHLRRELEGNFLLRRGKDSAQQARIERVYNSKRIVGRKFFIGTSLVSLAVFGSALVLFLAIPRIGFGFFFDPSRGGLTMAGFHDGVELGGHGLIKSDDRVVMRVTIDSRYEGRSAPSLHWRGVAFDKYAKGEWRRSRSAPMTEQYLEYDERKTVHHLLYAQGNKRLSELVARRERAVRQEIYLEPMGYDVLFGASMPVAFEFKNKIKQSTRSSQNDELRQAHTAGIRYVVYSDPQGPLPSEMRKAPPTLPKGYEVYLQIPEEIPQRVRDLAARITAGATTNYDKAVALRDWLQTKLDYTLQMESPGDLEPIDFFLFERKKGHCEYFSSAMAIMGRSVGLPTRNVNGFLGGGWNSAGDYIAVRAGDAHSWVEVYFDGVGWVTFDPTPPGEADRLGRGSSGFLDSLREMADNLRFKWFKWVIEYDLYRQLDLFRRVGKALKGGTRTLFKEPMQNAKKWAKRHKTKAAVIIGILALLIAGYALSRQRKQVRSLVRDPKRSGKAHPVTLQYAQALNALARRGYRRSHSTTPREFARNLSGKEIPGALLLSELTELYYECEYGPQSLGEARSESVDRAKELRAELVRTLKDNKVRASKKGDATTSDGRARA